MEEARSGGLIDKYWILDWIILPLILIGSTIAIIYFIGHLCPYTEDVSSCFPYNLPTWVKLSIPLIIIIIALFLIIIVRQIKSEKVF